MNYAPHHQAAMDAFRRPHLPPSPDGSEIRYALVRRIAPHEKPVAFADIKGLARHIQRQRAGRAVQLIEVPDLAFWGEDRRRLAVQVFALNAEGAEDECLGYAWLNGQGRDALMNALTCARPALTAAQTAD